MATVAGIKIKPKTKRITSEKIREDAKKDRSPVWSNIAAMTSEEYSGHVRKALEFYRMESSPKELKPKVIDWMGRNGYDKTTIQRFKKTKEWRCHLTMGAIAACLIKGMPDIREGFNSNRSAVEWLKREIDTVIRDGENDQDDAPAATEAAPVKPAAPVLNIQDRLREAAVDMVEDIDTAVDIWITDPDTFDPKSFKIVSMLRGKGCKAAHVRHIKGFYKNSYDELMELASGKADEQLREGYNYQPRKHVKKMIEFYESIMAACDQISAEAKVLKKPRPKKIKPAEQLVSKLKFCIRNDQLGIVSVPPAQIIGAQSVVLYNVKTRKLAYLISKTSEGLGVKGMSITEFTDTSVQKSLRKPAEQIKEFKEQNTQKRFETWFAKNVKTVETKFSGRLSEDTIILKAFK